MMGFALRARDDGSAALVVRPHDLSGCDYEGVLVMPRAVADEIVRRGMVIRQEDAIRGIGRPGIVVDRRPEGDALIEVRADVADPTTVVSSSRLDAFVASGCSDKDPTTISWVVDPAS